MIHKHQYFNFCIFILITAFVSSTNAEFCSALTSPDDKDTPCFLQPPPINPSRLRSSGNSLVLPCHVARSKRSTIEWWYQDFQKTVNIKIYPVFPAVRPTVLRFITTIVPTSNSSNETDVIDASVLLRHANVDDSGIYRCVVRPWTPTHMINFEDGPSDDDPKTPTLTYHLELTGPRLCQSSLGQLPCFSNMRTSSPTIVDGYQTAFLQCVVHSHNRPVNVFWVVGNASVNSVLITDYLGTNQYNGDRLRRIFPLSPFDYSIELTINREIRERTYSCVIDGATDVDTTLFTYIVRAITVDDPSEKLIKARKNGTEIVNESVTGQTTTIIPEKLSAHDSLTPEQVEELRKKTSTENPKTKDEDESVDEDVEDMLAFYGREETTTS